MKLGHVEEKPTNEKPITECSNSRIDNITFEYVNLPSDFRHICTICKDPLVDPIISMGVCWHKSCKTCGERWAQETNTCPICRKEGFGENFINFDDLDVKYELDNLDVKCPHCTLIVKRGNLRDHLQKTCLLLEKKVKLENEYFDKENNLKKSYDEMKESLSQEYEKLKTNLLHEIEQRENEFNNQVLSRKKYENQRPIQLRLIDMIVFVSIDSFVNNDREPNNSIGAMLLGEYPSYNVPSNTMENPLFININYPTFNHILNWLKNGMVPHLNDYLELIRACEEYQFNYFLLKIQEYKNYHPISQFEFHNFLRWNTRQVLSGFKFQGLNMKDIDLSNFEIKNSIIIDIDFTLSRLSNIRFVCCKFINVRFKELENVVFIDCVGHRLPSMDKLVSLLSHWKVKIRTKEIGDLINLTTLDVQQKDIGDKGAKQICKLINLTQLNIDDNKIGDEGVKKISKLINLTQLSINNNDIRSKGATEIGKLINLTQLNINNNDNIRSEDVKEIGKLINLTQLSINKNRINEGAKEIGKLINLTQLNIDDNDIRSKDVKEIGKLINLTQLSINNNKIGHEGAKEIGKLINLTQLSIYSNDIGDKGAKEIGKLINLTQLYFQNNKIGDEGAKEIGKLINLTQLNINNNDNIRSEGVKEIGKLINLTQLSFGYIKFTGSEIRDLLRK